MNSEPQRPSPPPDRGTAPPGRSLPLNLAYAIAGSSVFHLSNFAVLVLMAKFASPAVQGQYLFALALATPVILGFGFELRGALVADTHHQFSFGTYLAARGMALIPATLILAGLVAWQWWSGQPTAYVLLVAAVFVAQIVWSATDLGWATYQRRERLDLYAVSAGLRGLALIVPAAVLLPLYGWWHAHGQASPAQVNRAAAFAMLLYALGFMALHVFFDRPRVLGWRPDDLGWTWGGVRGLLVQTFPLALVTVIIQLCDAFPRWLFADVPDGQRQLGYFGSLAYVTQAGNLIILQAGNAAANRLAWYFRHDLAAWRRLLWRLIVLALLIGAAVIAVAFAWGDWLLRVLYTREYAAFGFEFRIVVIAHALALLTAIFGVSTTQMRVFWVQVPAQAVTLGATVLAAVVLIPGPTPVRGAALTVLVRAATQFVLYAGCLTAGLKMRNKLVNAGPDSRHSERSEESSLPG